VLKNKLHIAYIFYNQNYHWQRFQWITG